MGRAAWVVICLMLLSICGAALAATYTIQELGTLGGTSASACGISESGQIVGNSINADWGLSAFSWSGGTMAELEPLGGSSSSAQSVNGLGTIVGYSETADWDTHACIWQGGKATDLGTLGGFASYGYAVNDAGQVAGFSFLADGSCHAFSWQSGVMSDLGTLGGPYSYAYGINGQGLITGCSSTADGRWNAVMWSGGQISDLGIPGIGYAVNEAGDIVGMTYTADGAWRAFLYRGGQAGMIGGQFSLAHDINDNGQIVGQEMVGASTVACLWENGSEIDLNTILPSDSGWQLMDATGINNAGQIVGVGVLNGECRSFLLSPKVTALKVSIDIMPGTTRNRIRLGERGMVSVAILASEVPGLTGYFDPSVIDLSTVTLAGAPIAKVGKGQYKASSADLNGDGRPDLLVYFDNSLLQLAPTDSSAALAGKTVKGESITGQDSVVVEIPKKRR